MSIISNCTATSIKDAASTLIKGDLVAFPTETVYGLGADATNKDAIARVYKVKGRPVGHPLIVHISSLANLDKWARDIPEYAVNLARAFWPGPMTLILPRTDLAKDFITGSQDNVGVRVPSHTVALALLKEFEDQGGHGIAAPSANRFGKVSPTTFHAVEDELGEYLSIFDKVLDGGASQLGIESTIIDCTHNLPVILRPGYVTGEMVESLLSIRLDKHEFSNSKVNSPGLLKSHYSPNAQIILNGTPKPGDGLIALSHVPTPSGVIRLASPKDDNEYAHLLYGAFRLADSKGIDNLHVIPPLATEIGIAINNRIIKASNSYGTKH
jgi:L-threonylcarbamoyladenylate synthase